jgi:hypothetical protein
MINIMKRGLMPGLVLALMLITVSTGGFANAAASGSDDEMQDRDRIVAEYIANNPNAVLEIPFTEAQMKEAEIRKDITISKIHKVVSKGDLLQVQVNGSIVNAPPYMSVTHGQVMVPLRWSAELLGATSVEWDEAARTVTITTPQDFYSMEKFSAYARALKSPIEELNDQICPLPDKVKGMGLPELLPDQHFVLNLEQFRPEREGLTLPVPSPSITITITSPDGTYEHSSVAHSIENHQGHYYLPMDWLEYLFNARVSYNEAANILSIQTPDPEQIKSEIARIENVLIPDSSDEAIKLWGRGMQTRNGALQYAALSPQLRQAADQSPYVRQSYWVTGCSSPQVGLITIESRNELSDTKVEYTISFPEIFSGQTHAIATEKMVVEKLSSNGREGWFISQLVQSSGYGIIDVDNSLMDSQNADIDGDGQDETVQISGNNDNNQWKLIVKKDSSEAAVEIFKEDAKGFGASTIYAGSIIGHDSMDFLLATDYRSMPFGGCGYELYSLKDGAFNQIDLSNITKGTPFTIKVHENKQTAQITANRAVTVVPLSDWDLQGYRQYGDEFCQNFFIEMNLQKVPEGQLPELVTTEVIAATLPHHLSYLHTTYRYVDGAWRTQKTAFSDLP